MPILTTKLYIPPPRPKTVPRPHLIRRLNDGLHHKLTLISAPAGFGKSTLLTEWVSTSDRPVAWLSLDAEDKDPARFLAYLVAALQTIAPPDANAPMGQAVLRLLKAPQLPTSETVLTMLLNEIASLPEPFLLVLDDYHVVESTAVDNLLAFLLEYQPPHMHLVIATREDPPLPLPRLRARSQLTELRTTHLRFTAEEAATFLNQIMGLQLDTADIIALETRTEGWVAGLQLAALSLQGHAAPDTALFISSFTGSHRFVLDYLLEEVLHQQTDEIQTFLLRTAILERLCGELCEAVLGNTAVSGQKTLLALEQANLFLVPLDNERRWYRYHHLFADLLRQRLAALEAPKNIAEYHRRASIWYEQNGLELEAFQHATAAPDLDRADLDRADLDRADLDRADLDRATRLLVGDWMPLHFRGALAPVLGWLTSLASSDTAVLNDRPILWVMYASVLSMTGQIPRVEPTLQAAEAALASLPPEQTDTLHTRNLVGHIAAIRALLAAIQQDVEAIIDQSRRALDHLHPDNLAVRTATTWKLGFAYQLRGEYSAAMQAYREAAEVSRASGNQAIQLGALVGLGQMQEAENQLRLARASYEQVLQVTNNEPQPSMCEAMLGLAKLHYEWNEVALARQFGEQCRAIAQQIENLDRQVGAELFLARLALLAEDEVVSTAVSLTHLEQQIEQHQFLNLRTEATAVRVRLLLRQGHVDAAAELAAGENLPRSQARVALARGETTAVFAHLDPAYQEAQTRNWRNEQIKLLPLYALAHQQAGQPQLAQAHLQKALALGEPHGFIRTFVDEGPALAALLASLPSGPYDAYVAQLLAAFPASGGVAMSAPSQAQALVEPLSERELEVLALIAQGLSNREIGERLFLALSTVKGHNRNIYTKLQAQNRTEAVAHGRALGLLA